MRRHYLAAVIRFEIGAPEQCVVLASMLLFFCINHSSDKEKKKKNSNTIFSQLACKVCLSCLHDFLLYEHELRRHKIMAAVHNNKQTLLLITIRFAYYYLAPCGVKGVAAGGFSETVTRSQPAAAPQRPHVKQALPLPVTLC